MSTPPLDLALDLNHARIRANNLALDLNQAGDLASALDRARGLASALDRALDRASELALDPNHAGDLAGDLASALASNRANARDLVNDLAPTRDRDLASARFRARDLASDLHRASGLAADLALDLVSDRGLASDRGPLEREVRRVAPPAARLLAVVARLLPAADRARYDEEFRSELWDLAQAGAGRLRQVAYALRQLRCARLTVTALRSPRRRGVTP